MGLYTNKLRSAIDALFERQIGRQTYNVLKNRKWCEVTTVTMNTWLIVLLAVSVVLGGILLLAPTRFPDVVDGQSIGGRTDK